MEGWIRVIYGVFRRDIAWKHEPERFGKSVWRSLAEGKVTQRMRLNDSDTFLTFESPTLLNWHMILAAAGFFKCTNPEHALSRGIENGAQVENSCFCDISKFFPMCMLCSDDEQKEWFVVHPDDTHLVGQRNDPVVKALDALISELQYNPTAGSRVREALDRFNSKKRKINEEESN